MTVSAAAAKAGPYTGNDSASAFDFAFKVFADTDIRVVATVIATGVESDLVLNTDYTVTRNADQDNNPGGTVTYKVGGVTTAYPSTHKLTIVGDFVYEQPTDIPNGGAFFATVIENALDRLTLLIKQAQEKLDRALLVDVSSSLPPAQLLDALWQAAADAATSAGQAAASAIAAAASAVLASDWATKIDGAVSGGLYSARKYAADAAASALGLIKDSENLTHLYHPTLDGAFRDKYRAGWLPAWFNQRWGGAQWGGLPDGSFGSVATGNIQDDANIGVGAFVGQTANSAGCRFSESLTNPQIWVKVYKVGNPTDNLLVSFTTDATGVPGSTIALASSISGKKITSNPDGVWEKVSPSVGVLSGNTQYHVNCTRSGVLDASNYYVIKGSIVNNYPHGQRSSYDGTSWAPAPGQQLCFLIQNPAANSLLQSDGMFGNYKLAFNQGSPVNQSRSVAQPLKNFYDGKECSVLYRGTYAVSTNVWDFTYGLDHDRITLSINASGYPVLSVYRSDRTLAQVTGTASVTTGNHDVGIKVRTVGDGADYATLYVDGVSVGTPLTAQTFTMDKNMRELGTARLGDGFGIIPAWTQDMQMTSLPSAQGWTWAGVIEANAVSVQGGKAYFNANGYASTDTGYYTKTVAFNNATGWTVVWKCRPTSNTNSSTNGVGPCVVEVRDGAKLIDVQVQEYFIQVGSNSGSLDFTVQGDFKSQENVFVLEGKGSDYYLFCNGKLIVDGTGKLLTAITGNALYFGDFNSSAGENADAIWSYLKYYEGGMILPIATAADCSEFAHWSGDKSNLFAPLWNAGSPVSVKELCGVERNYIGEGVVQKEVRTGVTSNPTTTSTSMTLMPDMELYIIGEEIGGEHWSVQRNSTVGASNYIEMYLDGSAENVYAGIALPIANGSFPLALNLPKTKTALGLHKVDARWSVTGGTATTPTNDRLVQLEAKS